MPPSLDIRDLSEDPRARHALGQFIGRDAKLRAQLSLIPRIARSNASVLVAGETGTGKELAARAVHYLSIRASSAFVPVNCGALPTDLIENELFGHAAGAYTGALRDAEGLVREADGGTLFLDEVDSLPPASQVKILRFLQEKEFRPVGSRKPRYADVRIVAATSTDLANAVREGRFRADLYYRLNVVTLWLPPLRERRDDILDLALYFLRKYAAQSGTLARELSPTARQKITAYGWPGNVRELENVIHRAAVLAEGDCIEARELILDAQNQEDNPGTFSSLKRAAIADFERRYLSDLLRVHEGNITRAARAAGKHRRALWELIRKHGLQSGALSHARR